MENDQLDEFSDGGQPIHDAALAGSVDALNALLDLGAQIDSQQNPLLQTPIHLACRFNHLEIVRRLVEKGADLSLCDVDGNSPMDEASMRPETDMEIFELLKKQSSESLPQAE